MTAHERAVVRDLEARLRLAGEDMSALQRQKAYEIGALRKSVWYLKRDKQLALERAEQARRESRFWHGVALAHGAGNRRFEVVA